MSTQQLFTDDSNERSIVIEHSRAKDEPAIVADPLASGKWSLLIDMTAIVVDAPEFNDNGEPMYGPGGKWDMNPDQEHYILQDDINQEVIEILSSYGDSTANYRARKVYQMDSKQDVENAVDEVESLVMNEDNWKIRDSISDSATQRNRDVDDKW